MDALKTFRVEISPLHIKTSSVHELSSCLLSYPESQNGFANKESLKVRLRSEVLHELRKLLPPAAMMPAKRLEHLVDQALDLQRGVCIFHNSYNQEMSLYANHHCGQSNIPSHTSQEDGLLYIEVDPSGADSWKLEPVIEQLKQGAVGVIPTDTVYAIVCDMNSNSALERLRRIKEIEKTKPLSILCRSFHDIDVYTTGFPSGDNLGHPSIFRLVKGCLPGPYTFILSASKNLPKQCTNYGPGNSKYTPKKSIGVRMPDDPITQAIVEKLDSPLLSTSVKRQTEDEWILDPVVIADVYGKEGLDFVVDAGLRVAEPSTVVDMTGSLPKIIRLGKGPRLPWMVSDDD